MKLSPKCCPKPNRRMIAASLAMACLGCDLVSNASLDPVWTSKPKLTQTTPVDSVATPDAEVKLRWNPTTVESQPRLLVAAQVGAEDDDDEPIGFGDIRPDDPEPDGAGSASDWTTAELIPTPLAQKEVVAEIVPTPLGIPIQSKTVKKPNPPLFQSPNDPLDDLQGPKRIDLSKPSFGMPTTADVNIRVASATDPGLAATSPSAAPASSGSPAVPSLAAATPSPAAPALVPNTAGSGSVVDAGPVGDAVDAFVGETATGPEDHTTWPTPQLTLFVTGQQHGYIEPCGCTGLENQKGGVARRMTFATNLRDKGWPLAPIDAGNLIRRFGKQAEIKFHRSLESLREMGYDAVGFGPDDVRLGVGELLQEAAEEGNPERPVYASANVVLLDPSIMPSHRIIDRAGMKVGVTSILDPDSLDAVLSDEIVLQPIIDSAKDALAAIQAASPKFVVLTFYGEEKAAMDLVRTVPGFDLVVVAGGYGEPTYRPQAIEGSATKMILTGNKGMYVGLVGLYPDAPMRYARVPLTHEFQDAPAMRALMAEYQDQLQSLGLAELGLDPIPHPSGEKFTGSAACGKCHTTAYGIWQGSMHAEATEHLVHPGERGDVPRHFDPECLSCHVTGWNPQGYYPYLSGYLELEASSHLHGNGCENCHGPGASHAAAEEGSSTVSEAERLRLRESMRLPLEQARETCMKCHDLDNSPDFHEDGAFDDYWAEVEHYGVD